MHTDTTPPPFLCFIPVQAGKSIQGDVYNRDVIFLAINVRASKNRTPTDTVPLRSPLPVKRAVTDIHLLITCMHCQCVFTTRWRTCEMLAQHFSACHLIHGDNSTPVHSYGSPIAQRLRNVALRASERRTKANDRGGPGSPCSPNLGSSKGLSSFLSSLKL